MTNLRSKALQYTRNIDAIPKKNIALEGTNRKLMLVQTSPQYSLMKVFFWIAILAKIPQPATSDGANSKC